MSGSLDQEGLDLLFGKARTFSRWRDRPVTEERLVAIYELMKWGPTSMNCSPARFVFVMSQEAKERLKPCLSPGNVEKTMTAPVTVIVAHDAHFYEHLPMLFPHADGRSLFADDPTLAAETAFRNGTLQGAYLILAARAHGLDVGPMSGFDNAKVDAAFFPDGRYRSNFLANIGYGDSEGLYPRGPRLGFDEVASVE